MTEWHDFVTAQREKELAQIIQEEKLREPETRKFLESAFRDGEIKTTGTDIDRLMPPSVAVWRGRRKGQEEADHYRKAESVL